MNDQLIIEQTIKRSKAFQLAGVVIIIVGMGAVGGAIMAQSTGLIYVAAILPAFGIIITAYGSLMTWWHHG
jgi:fatty acid desaturase